MSASDDASPCVKICVVDPQSDICIGCGRSRKEIAEWKTLDASSRKAIREQLPQRLKTLAKGRRRGGADARRRKTP